LLRSTEGEHSISGQGRGAFARRPAYPASRHLTGLGRNPERKQAGDVAVLRVAYEVYINFPAVGSSPTKQQIIEAMLKLTPWTLALACSALLVLVADHQVAP
jgi:hypothetical protein